jgi:ADP-heptose:LPS heptosyltransferase
LIAFAEDELVFTGYVTDTDLIRLYNSCKLFVFPSLHEGFGLPPLEAMACGAPVIVANVTSLTEVVGRAEATFDPESTESITAKLDQVLSDEKFSTNLVRNGLIEAKNFSWEQSARRALDALKDFEPAPSRKIAPVLNFEKTSMFRRNKKKILLIKLDHMGDMMLAIPAMRKLRARYPYASLEIVVGSWNVPLAKELQLFDKIYAFDYYRPQSAQAASATDAELKALLSQLGNYDIAIDLRRQRDTRFVLVEVAAELRVGYQTFDPSIDNRLQIALKSFADAPFVKTPLNGKHASVQMLELVDALPEDVNDFIDLPPFCERPAVKSLSVAMFPNAGNNVKEWAAERYWALATLLAADTKIEAVNVYFAKSGDVQKAGFSTQPKIHIHVGLGFSELARSLSSNAVCVANNSFGAHLGSYLGLVVIGVFGGHETVDEWAPVFGDSYVIHRQADCSPCHIAKLTDCKHDMFCLADISHAQANPRSIACFHSRTGRQT